MVSVSAAEAAQMLTQQTEEAQEKSRTSLHHQIQCRSCLDERHGPAVGKPGAFGLVVEERLKSAVCAALQKARKLEGVRCGCVKACVGRVLHQFWFADEKQRSLEIEAVQDRPVAAQTKSHSREAIS